MNIHILKSFRIAVINDSLLNIDCRGEENFSKSRNNLINKNFRFCGNNFLTHEENKSGSGFE